MAKKEEKSFYIDGGNLNAKNLLKAALDFILYKKDNYEDIILLCIGTDRATGDCLGPLCGHKLENITYFNSRIKLYGTLNKPVHAKNLTEVIEKIKVNHKNPLVIAIDACLGRTEHIGFIIVKEGGINPGAAFNKGLPKVGDISIAGIVDEAGDLEVKTISNTRLNVVMQLADIISQGIMETL